MLLFAVGAWPLQDGVGRAQPDNLRRRRFPKPCAPGSLSGASDLTVARVPGWDPWPPRVGVCHPQYSVFSSSLCLMCMRRAGLWCSFSSGSLSLAHAATLPASNGALSTSMRCRMTASLRASAILALPAPLCRCRRRAQDFRPVPLATAGRVRMTWAAS